MKKTLVALAALAATSAFAQSSVTIYGQFDAGVYSLKDVKVGTAVGGVTVGTGKSSTVYGDGATFSNVLGFRGTEDMGAGLKAGFHFETDVQTNNGGLNNAGLFRRQANGSIESATLGQIKLGVTTNPVIATNALLMPVSGNSVSTATSSALGYADFYTKNALTYTSPSVMGLVGQFQKGMSNNLDSDSAGGVTAWSLNYTNGPLALRAAAQDRKQGGVSSSSNASTSAIGTANTAGFNKKGSIMGASYAIGPVTVAAASLKTENATTLGGARTERKGTQMGVGYTTGAWTLGGSLTKAEDSKLTNLQARYALSKRTNVIGTYGIADNSSKGLVNFAPLAFNTGTAPAAIVTDYAGATNVKTTGMGVALTHSF
jgi:predicted porin